MKRLAIFAVGVAPLLAGAGNYDVPSGDLASASTWGSGMPTGSDIIIFRSNTAALRTYTLSADTTLTAYAITSTETGSWSEKGVLFDFSNGNHTLTLSKGFGMRNTCSHVTFRGGTWDAGSNKLWLTDDSTWMMAGATTTVDNVTFRCGEFNLLNYYSACGITISNSSTVVASGDAYFGRHSPDTCHGLIEILGGSKVQVAGKTYMGHNTYGTTTAADHDLNVLVAGEGTKLEMGTGGNNESWIGYGLSGNSLVVSDHAEVSAYQFIIGQGGSSCSNVLTIKGGASVKMAAGLEMARWASSSQGNRIEVLDGGELAVGTNNNFATLYVGNAGHHNSLLVSNATLSCRYPLVGSAATANYNVAEVRGSLSRLTLNEPSSHWYLFGEGSENHWIFADCCTNIYPRSILFANVCSNGNTVTVKDGAVLGAGDAFYLGSVSVPNERSRLEVLNGAVVSANGGLFLRGSSPSVVVSNATLAVGNDQSSSKNLRLGNDSDKMGCVGATLTLQGSAPVVKGNGGRIVVHLVNDCKAKIRFELPVDSVYSEAPINCNQFQVGDDSTLEIVNVERLQRKLLKRTKIPLVFADDGTGNGHKWLLENDRARLKKANATLPSGCYLGFDPVSSTSGYSGTIYLSVKSGGGMVVIYK